MNLALWIPLTVSLGLMTLALMFLFVEICDRI